MSKKALVVQVWRKHNLFIEFKGYIFGMKIVEQLEAIMRKEYKKSSLIFILKPAKN